MAERRVTLADIARATGVSPTTVSYVLSGRGGISPTTREKVLRVAKEMGYNRRQGASPQIGRLALLIYDPEAGYASGSASVEPSYVISEIVQGIATRLRSHSTELVYIATAGQSAELPAEFTRHGPPFQGIFVCGSQFQDPFLKALTDTGIPCVLVGTYSCTLPVDGVVADNAQGLWLATKHVIERGHRRIALLNGPAHSSTSREKLRGYLEALVTHGLGYDPDLIKNAEFGIQPGFEAARQLLSLPERPTAILTADDQLAVGAIRAIREAGLRIPDDIAVVGYYDTPLAEATRPPLTTVRMPRKELGELAAERMILRLSGSSAAVRLVLQTSLVVRDST